MFIIRELLITLLCKVWLVDLYAVGDELATSMARCSCNRLTSYAEGISVKCSYLNLSDIPVSLPSSVRTFDVSHNVIRTLKNDSFPKYLTLSTVILSYNKLEDIQLNVFAGLQTIRNIDLSYNNLKSIHPDIFTSNRKLEFLHLRSNPLTNLLSQSPILVSDTISSLDLSLCSLTSVDPVTFSRLPSLYSLDLSSNRLSTLSVTTLEHLTELRVLNVANNRWICNCSVVELMHWARNRSNQLLAHKPIKCLTEGKYTTLWTAAGKDESCNEPVTPTPLVSIEATTDTATTLKRLPASPKIANYSYSSPDLAITILVTNWDETTVTRETETGVTDGLFSWDRKTILVFLILPCTLGITIFLSLIAVNFFTRRWLIHHPQYVKQNKDNHLAANLSHDIQLTTNTTKKNAGYMNINSQRIPYDTRHIYEEII
jgi:Leucine-rich repeat (LRR) protein